MSAIHSALDEMFAVDDSDLSELAADVAELSHVAQMVDVLRSRKTRSLSDRGGHHQLGYSSPTAFLVDQTGMSPGRAKRIISYGNAKEKAPYPHQAWVEGRLSTDQAQHLFRAAEALPDVYPDAEQRLVDIVEGLDSVDTGKAVGYWWQSVDGPGDVDAETRWARRGVSLSRSMGGMRESRRLVDRPSRRSLRSSPRRQRGATPLRRHPHPPATTPRRLGEPVSGLAG
ncbi:MAG TPA: DUF222 domain-containing protein [Acidimicrobiia bacterium]